LRDDIMAAAPRASKKPGNAFVVVMVASLTRPKLQHIAIAAFAEAAQDIPALRLRLIGLPLDQQYHGELQQQIAASAHADRIDLVPGLSRGEAIAALADAEVFLLPSLVEGCSMALLEAAAQGCVCILSDVGAARELYSNGDGVVLLPSPLGELEGVTQQQFLEAAHSPLPEHRDYIAAALRQVWRDYGLFVAGAAETRARLRERCDMRRMTEAYLDAYAMAYRGGGRGAVSAEAAVLAPA
jgi:glycosyltransferase involved in cell wall biosynthesis